MTDAHCCEFLLQKCPIPYSLLHVWGWRLPLELRNLYRCGPLNLIFDPQMLKRSSIPNMQFVPWGAQHTLALVFGLVPTWIIHNPISPSEIGIDYRPISWTQWMICIAGLTTSSTEKGFMQLMSTSSGLMGQSSPLAEGQWTKLLSTITS